MKITDDQIKALAVSHGFRLNNETGDDLKPYVYEFARDLIALATKVVERENMWQPIESAPTDGSPILLAKIAATEALPDFGIEGTSIHVWWVVKGYWDKWEYWSDGHGKLVPPTHWMPLPEPPK